MKTSKLFTCSLVLSAFSSVSPTTCSSACQTPAPISAWVITADPKHCMWLRCHFLPQLSFPCPVQNNRHDCYFHLLPRGDVQKHFCDYLSPFLSIQNLFYAPGKKFCLLGIQRMLPRFPKVAYNKTFQQGMHITRECTQSLKWTCKETAGDITTYAVNHTNTFSFFTMTQNHSASLAGAPIHWKIWEEGSRGKLVVLG